MESTSTPLPESFEDDQNVALDVVSSVAVKAIDDTHQCLDVLARPQVSGPEIVQAVFGLLGVDVGASVLRHCPTLAFTPAGTPGLDLIVERCVTAASARLAELQRLVENLESLR